MASFLPIIDTALTGLGRAVWSFPRLLGIYVPPWLLGTIALILLDVVLQEHLRLGWAPQWARSLVWAPFAAVANVLLLRWLLYERTPQRARETDLTRQIAFAVPIVMVWLGTVDALKAVPIPVLLSLIEPDAFGFRWESVDLPLYALHAAAWLAVVAANACFFGLIAVVVEHGWPDVRKLWRLLRLRPVHLFVVAILAAAAFGGVEALNNRVLAWTGLDRLMPHSMIPWRANIHWAFAAELTLFPTAFAGFAVECGILAEAYRRLLQITDRDQPQLATAT